MNQEQTAMADVFTRLSEQAAGTADAAQPSHAPFFAPLRDVDLPAPAAVLAGANEAATAFAPWAGGTVVSARTGWLDPLIPPDATWADRPVPTLAWLASTLPPDAAASPGDAPVAAPATPAAEGLEPSTEAGLRPPAALDATKLIGDAAVLAPAVTNTAVALPPPSAPVGLSDLGPNRQAGGTAAHDDTIEVNAGAQAGAAHAATNALVSHDGSESPGAVTAEGKWAAAADIRSPGAEPAGEIPARPSPAPVQPDLRDEVSSATVLPVPPAAAPAAMTTSGLPDAASGVAAPPVQTIWQPLSAAAEGRPLAEDKVVDAHGRATQLLPRKTPSPIEAAPAGLELHAQPGLLRPEADFALQPGEETGGPPPVSGIPPLGGTVLPRTVQALQMSPGTQPNAAIGTAGKQAPVAAVTGMAGSSPHDTHMRDVPAVQVGHAHEALAPEGRSPVQPAATRSAERGDAMTGDTTTVAGAPVADSPGVKQQEPRVAAPPQPISHVDAIRPAESVRTAAGHEVVQSTGVPGAELRHASSMEAAVRALTALPRAAPHASAPVPPLIEAIPHEESARTEGNLQTVYRALEVVTASALSQPRNEALAPYPPTHPMADALVSTDRPTIQPRLLQAVAAAAAASRAGRYSEPEALPTVHVTIGRIEVRFAAPAGEQAPSARQPSRQNLPLHAILQRDAWGAA